MQLIVKSRKKCSCCKFSAKAITTIFYLAHNNLYHREKCDISVSENLALSHEYFTVFLYMKFLQLVGIQKGEYLNIVFANILWGSIF